MISASLLEVCLQVLAPRKCHVHGVCVPCGSIKQENYNEFYNDIKLFRSRLQPVHCTSLRTVLLNNCTETFVQCSIVQMSKSDKLICMQTETQK